MGNPALLLRPRVSATTFAAIALTAFGLALAPAALAGSSGSAGTGRQVVEYRLPFLAGQTYTVTQGWHGSYSHTGKSAYAYDFGLPEGTPVLAAAPGVVAFVRDGHHGCGDESYRAMANSITIYHADGTATSYAHLSHISVKVGQVVTGGERIGLSGKTGFTGCQAHLHFARQRQGRAATQSIPVYFAETGRHRLRVGAEATSANPVCAQTTTGLPDGAFCALYSRATDLGILQVTHLERAIRVGSRAAPGPHGARPAAAPIAASWLGRFTFTAAGIYTFTVTTDRDVRLSIDGTLVLDTSADPTGTQKVVLQRWMPSGEHVIDLEYESGPTPILQFDWRLTGPDTTVRSVF